MTDHEELRRKAEAARDVYESTGGKLPIVVIDKSITRGPWGVTARVYDADEVTTRLSEYIAAADPDTILAVLDELEQVKRERDELRAELEECDDAYRSVAGG